jgi:hypothetical protein
MLPTKRLVFLDGLRGVAIIGMMITHALEFANFNPASGQIIYFEPNSPMTRAPLEPLASMTTIFFCIMGMSLPVSLAIRKQKQESFLSISKHMGIRAAWLVLAGLLLAFGAQFALGTGSGLALVFNGKEPISMIGFANLFAFPVIYFFPSWRKLLALSGISYVLVTVALIFPIAPYLGIIGPLLLAGPWSMLKCLPVILFGSGLVAAVVQNQPISKKILLVLAISLFALLNYLLPIFIEVHGSMYYFMVPEVVYQMSLGYIVFKFLEEQGHNIIRHAVIPFLVAGRTGLYLYMIQMVYLVVFLLYIPHVPGTLTAVLVSSVSLIPLWTGAFLYMRWKVGDISAQYVSTSFANKDTRAA